MSDAAEELDEQVPPARESGPRRLPVVQPDLTREQLRSRRKREVRAQSVISHRMSKHEVARELEIGRILFPEDVTGRPRTRGECAGVPRPCPYVACKYHLYLDVNEDTGTIRLNFPDLEPDELEASCALDVADDGGATLERTGDLMNITRERIRQTENLAIAAIRPEMLRLMATKTPGGTK